MKPDLTLRKGAGKAVWLLVRFGLRHLIAAFQLLKGAYKKDGERILLLVAIG